MKYRMGSSRGVVAAIAVAFLMLPSGFVAAHELMTDSTHTQTAILHVDPDDNVIAGEPATIYFEPRNYSLLQVPDASVTLTIQKDGRVQTRVRMKIAGELASQRYTFASEGVYTLEFNVVSGNTLYTFSQSQQVKPNPDDAMLAAWVAAAGLLVIVVLGGGIFLAVRRRRTRKSAPSSEDVR